MTREQKKLRLISIFEFILVLCILITIGICLNAGEANEENYLLVANTFFGAIIFSQFVVVILISISLIRMNNTNLLIERQRNELEERKRELESELQIKADFLSRLSHEMRTPLNTIIGCENLANKSYQNNEDISDDLSMIKESGEFMVNLLNDILDVSRIEANILDLHESWICARDILKESLNDLIPLMKEKNIDFEYPTIFFDKIMNLEFYVDSQRIEQILVNLLNNAYKFTPEGGSIKFIVNHIENDEKYSIDEFIITDTGCGMSKEFLTHIGEPFITEKNELNTNLTGSGMGLQIVKKLIELMGGELVVESEIGKGSTFKFKIKYKYRLIKEEDRLSKVKKSAIDFSGMKVLYAEDNPMNQIVVSKLLERENVIVDIATNGKEAVQKFSDSAFGEYSLILMDMRMPVMDGKEATIAIRQLDREDSTDIQIVALSADAMQAEIESAKESGLSDYLTKPIKPVELYKSLEKGYMIKEEMIKGNMLKEDSTLQE